MKDSIWLGLPARKGSGILILCGREQGPPFFLYFYFSLETWPWDLPKDFGCSSSVATLPSAHYLRTFAEISITVESCAWFYFKVMKDFPRREHFSHFFSLLLNWEIWVFTYVGVGQQVWEITNIFPKNPLNLRTWIKIIMKFAWIYAEAGLQSNFKLGAGNF